MTWRLPQGIIDLYIQARQGATVPLFTDDKSELTGLIKNNRNFISSLKTSLKEVRGTFAIQTESEGICGTCSACCGPAPLYSAEVIEILNYLIESNGLLPIVRASIARCLVLFDMAIENNTLSFMPVCPFLHENKCLIYCVRPSSCRMFGFTENTYFSGECRFFEKNGSKTSADSELLCKTSSHRETVCRHCTDSGILYKKIRELYTFSNAPDNGVYYINHPVFLLPAQSFLEFLIQENRSP